MISVRNPDWLDTAARIGARTVQSALWSGEQCNWNVWGPQRIPGVRQGHWVPGGPSLYQGSSGTGLFLAELYRHTGDADTLRTAMGALRNAQEGARDFPASSASFYAGRVGVAYAFYRLALMTGREDLLTDADALLRPLTFPHGKAESTDVIGGAAGSIPPLLEMAAHLPADITTNLALQLGGELIVAARPRTVGWSWGGTASAVDDLTGFAHGASGYAHAFTELFAVTGDPWFRYGAEQALAYERTTYDASRKNWPDFRHTELSEYVASGNWELLRAKARSAEGFPEYVKSFSITWCHGAPGMGLTRCRSFEVFGDAASHEEATIAAASTLATIRNEGLGYSLCHGYFGNCETLLAAERVLGGTEFRQAVVDRARFARERFELGGRPWPGGTLGGVTDPSLLLGEAGIGYFYLRLYDETTPAFLCLNADPSAHAVAWPTRDSEKLRHVQISQYFGTSIRAFERLQPSLPSLQQVQPSSPDQVVSVVYDAIRERIAAETDVQVRTLLTDASAAERLRFESECEFNDQSEEFVARQMRPDAPEVPWATGTFRLHHDVKVVDSVRDWSKWITEGDVAADDGDDSVSTALFRVEGAVKMRTVSPLAAAVLTNVVEPRTAAEIAAHIASTVQGATAARLLAPVLKQLESAYVACLIDWVPAVAETETSGAA